TVVGRYADDTGIQDVSHRYGRQIVMVARPGLNDFVPGNKSENCSGFDHGKGSDVVHGEHLSGFGRRRAGRNRHHLIASGIKNRLNAHDAAVLDSRWEKGAGPERLGGGATAPHPSLAAWVVVVLWHVLGHGYYIH